MLSSVGEGGGCGSTWSDGHSGLHELFLSTTELEAIEMISDHYIILVTRRRGLSTVRDLLRSGHRPTRCYLNRCKDVDFRNSNTHVDLLNRSSFVDTCKPLNYRLPWFKLRFETVLSSSPRTGQKSVKLDQISCKLVIYPSPHSL